MCCLFSVSASVCLIFLLASLVKNAGPGLGDKSRKDSLVYLLRRSTLPARYKTIVAVCIRTRLSYFVLGVGLEPTTLPSSGECSTN